jgi:hypothetical protein
MGAVLLAVIVWDTAHGPTEPGPVARVVQVHWTPRRRRDPDPAESVVPAQRTPAAEDLTPAR